MTQKCTAAAVRGSPQVQSRRKRRQGRAGELSWDHRLRDQPLSIDLERKASLPIFLKPWERDEKVRSCQFLPQSSPLTPSPCQPIRMLCAESRRFRMWSLRMFRAAQNLQRRSMVLRSTHELPERRVCSVCLLTARKRIGCSRRSTALTNARLLQLR